MDWSIVRIEPFGRGNADDATCCYRFRFPLLGDGRVSLTHLVRAPERAAVERRNRDLTSQHGVVRLVDNQLTCVWHPERGVRLPELRIIGSRFSLGDKVALRSSGRPIALFQVCEWLGDSEMPLAS